MLQVRDKIYRKSVQSKQFIQRDRGGIMSYTCFYCRKEVPDELRGKKIRCPYCGNKVLIKERGVTTKVSAR